MLDRRGELGGGEGHPAHAVEADGVHEVLGADQLQELAEVQLGDEDAVVGAEDVAEVAREGVQVRQVRVGDLRAALAGVPDAGRDRPARPAPAEDEQVRALLVVDGQLGDVRRDPGDLRARRRTIRSWFSGS